MDLIAAAQCIRGGKPVLASLRGTAGAGEGRFAPLEKIIGNINFPARELPSRAARPRGPRPASPLAGLRVDRPHPCTPTPIAPQPSGTIEFGEFVQLWGYLTCLQKGVCLFDEGEGAEQLSEVETRGRLGKLSKEKDELQRELDLCQSKLLDLAQEELTPGVTERNVNEVTTT